MKAIVLLSGGVDSTTCLAMAVNKYGCENITAVNIHYGQKHQKELEQAKLIAKHYNVKYVILDLSHIFKQSNCSLLAHSTEDIVHKSYAEQLAEQPNETVSTYVPFRNGLMLSAAASFAQSIEANEVWYGAHHDDAAGNAYPDCSTEFVNYMSKAIFIGSGNDITLVAPFIESNKAQIVAEGLKLHVPYELTWSCYEGKEKPCGSCATCIDRQNAFIKNGVIDPLDY